MSFERILFVIPLMPVAKARARSNLFGSFYTPNKTKYFETSIAQHWKGYKYKMIPKVPTSVSITCDIPRPKSVKKSIQYPITRPDIDNYAKSIIDALNGHAWKDDNQIVELKILKQYTENTPIITVIIKPAEQRIIYA